MKNIRHIETQEEIDKRKKRNQLLVGGILIVLMVFSSLGYAFMNNDGDTGSGTDTQIYNGMTFTRTGDYWLLENSELKFYFRYLPQNVSDVLVSMNKTMQDYNGKVIYFVNANRSAATQDILNVLGDYVLRYQEACMNGKDCGEEMPQKTCADNVIVLGNAGNLTRVMQNENCVYIDGDYLRGAAAFSYRILGIA